MQKKTKKSSKQNGKDSIPKEHSRFAADEFLDKNCKVRITTFIDVDVYKKLKTLSKKTNEGYQTLLNKALRWSVLEANYFEHEEMAKALNEIEAKIRQLEAQKKLIKMVG